MRLGHNIPRTAPDLDAIKTHLEGMLLLFRDRATGLDALRGLLTDLETKPTLEPKP